MTELLPLFISALMIAYVIETRDQILVYRRGHRESFFTFLLIILLATFCGLRTWYNDTVTYLQIFDQTPSLEKFWTSDDAKFAGGYGFGLLNAIIKEAGFYSQDYLMFYALWFLNPES